MLYLLSALVILMAIIGGGTITMVDMFRQQSQQINSTYTQQHLDEVAQIIIENTRTADSSTGYGFYPPAADTLAGIGYSTIPTWLSLTAHTAQGVAFLYCPFSNITTGTKAQTVTLPDSTTYAVANTANYSGAQRQFVTVSDAAPGNTPTAIAIIVAPVNSTNTPPSCLNVNSSGQITGAYTRVITKQNIWQRQLRIAQNSEKLYIAPSAAGDSTGHNTSNAFTLNAGLNYLKLFEPENLRFELAVGTHALTGSGQTIGTASLLNTGVEWAGVNSSTLINNISAATITLNNKNYLQQLNVPVNQTTALAWTSSMPGSLWFGDIRPARTYLNTGGPIYYGGNFYAGNFTGGATPVQQSNSGDRTFIDGNINLECVNFNNRRGYFTANSVLNHSYQTNANCFGNNRAYLYSFDDQVFINGAINMTFTNGTPISKQLVYNSLLGPRAGNLYTCGARLDGGGAAVPYFGAIGAKGFFGCNTTGDNLAYGTALFGGISQLSVGVDGGTFNVASNMSGTVDPYVTYAFGNVGIYYDTKLAGGTDGNWPAAIFNSKSTSACWSSNSTTLFADSKDVAGGVYSKPDSTVGPTYAPFDQANSWLYTYNRTNWYCTRP